MKAYWKTQGIRGIAIVVLTVLVYLPALRGGFVWDDDYYVTENQLLRSPGGLRTIWTQPGAGQQQYYPLVFTGFWAEYHLWKLQPLGYHLVNVLLHAVNAVLLWRVLRRLEIPGAWWAAAIFALHPVLVESVAWITELKNVTSGMFSLLSLLAFLHFRPLSAPETTTGWDWRYYRLATLLFLCALLSKTAVCCLPVVIGVLMWWKLGRITKRDVQVLLPWFAASVIMGLITMRVESPPVEVGATGRPFSIVHGWLQAGRALWFYAGKLFWPSQLTFVYPRWNIDAGTARQNLFPLAALAVVIVLWWLRGRIGKGPLAAVLCFAAMLTPVLGFFDIYFFNFSYVADHFQYMASIGLMALAAGAGATVIQRAGPQGRAFGALVGAVVLLILGVCTWRQAATYHDLETLWRDTLTKNSNAWLAHGNLGVILLREKKDADAQAEFEAALRIKPDYYEAHCNRGLALASQGRSLEAMAEYRETLRLKPDWPPALVSSAWLLATAEDPGIRDGREAVRLAERVCEVTHYRQVDALLALAAAYAEAGRAADAVPIARKVILWVRASGQEKIAAQIEAQLKLYQDGHPDHKGSPYPLLPE